jgi:hypothetical protein
MDIYIDESGSFVCTDKPNAWSVVAAYVTYSSQRVPLLRLLNQLKLKCGKSVGDEIKLKHISESDLKWFIHSLSDLDGIFYCTGTDVSMVTKEIIEDHRNVQAAKVVEQIEKMQHQSMKNSLRDLSADIEGLSSQLYVQLIAQFTLINDIINRSTLYYSQSRPSVLSNFKWFIDQKNTTKIVFEEAFEKMAPAILQTISLREPFIELKEGDYSFMAAYTYNPKTVPTYLEENYGLPKPKGNAFNIGKIVRDEMQFVDSKANPGVQVADILASTSRRILRDEFEDNSEIAHLLGGLMLSNTKEKGSMGVISFVDGHIENQSTANSLNIIDSASRAILLS